MAKLQVLSKGKYLDPQPNQPVTLSQYIFAIQDKAKYLLLRFKNERTETLTGVKFAVKQLNAKGNEIDTSIVECDDLKGASNGLVTINKKIEVKRDCADFKVYLIDAIYGKYVYSVKNHATYLSYNDAVTVQSLRPDEIFKKLGNTDRAVTVRKVNKPLFTTLMAIVAVVMVLATAIVQTLNYKSSAKTFTLYNVNYKIVANGEIYVTGYRGEATNVTIPEVVEGYRVTGMNENAFANNSKLKKLVINSSIEIPSGAFQNCDNLVSVELKKVKSIGESAFEDCASLTSVKADSLELIDTYAFYLCPKLTTVEISNQTNNLRIGLHAFGNCGEINLLKIDQEINYAYNVNMFEGSTINELYLKNIATRPLEDYFGYAMADATKLTVEHADNIPLNFLRNSAVTSLTFNSLATTKIRNSAFEGVTYLEEFHVGTKVTEIGERAFAQTSLKEFNFKGVEIIGESAFSDCESLQNVDLSTSAITYLPQNVFNGCEDLETLKLSTKITAIDKFAFKDCSSLTEVVIPANVESLGIGAFSGCNKLKKMTVPYIGGSLDDNTIMGYLFFDSESAVSYDAPLSLEQISVTSTEITDIPQGAFYGFEGLKKVTFASPIRTVDQRAFFNCEALNDFPFSESLVGIGEEAFANTGFVDVTIPASVVIIYDRAFAESSKLKSIRVPSTTEEIGQGFLANCNNLESITIPYVGANKTLSSPLSYFTANATLEKLTAITITSEDYTLIADSAFANAIALTDVSLPNSIISVGDYAFSGCESLETLNLPNTVEFIGYGAFTNAGLKSFSIPTQVTEIEGETFGYCRKLRTVTIPESVENIASDAFYSCLYLHEVYNYSALDVTVGSTNNGYVAENALVVYARGDSAVPKVVSGAYEFLKIANDWILAYCNEDVETVALPSQVSYQGNSSSTYSILRYTFMNMWSIESVQIPSTVTEIGDYAFYACENLSSVSVEAGNLSRIGICAFYECGSLEDFNFVNSLNYIGEQAFYNCYSLQDISLAGSISQIGEETFYNCTSAQTIVLPSTVQTIGARAFSGCHLVLNVVLPSSLRDIGEDAFYGCNSLMSVWNRSTRISVSVGSDSNGGVAKYAKTVKNSYDSYSFEVFTDGNYQVIYDNGSYWLYKFNGTIDNSLLKLPETLTHKGSTVYYYGLFKDVFNDISQYYNLYVPTSVNTIDDRVFNGNHPDVVYYASTRNSWNYLTGGGYLPFAVYYYSQCIHETGYWKYTDNGSITTSIDQPTYSVVQPATCKTDGYSRWDCPYCAHYETRPEYALGHSFGADGNCIRCTAKRVKITSANINLLSNYITINLGQSFTIDESGYIRSTNTTSGTTATLSITLKVTGITLQFDYGVSSSSSSNYGYYEDFELGNSNNIRYGSYNYHEYSRTGTIRFSYYCGNSYYGSDYGYIYDLYVIIP